MASKWEPVAELLAHIAADDDLMRDWARKRYGDLRSEAGVEAGVHLVRQELVHLIAAVQDRTAPSSD